jgi:putative ABC transport system substrate-binding protein
MTVSITRRALLGSLAALPLASAWPAVAGRHAGPWFLIDEKAQTSWVVVPATNDPLRVTLRRRSAQGTPRYRVLVLYPRPSSAYDIAMSKILEVFDEKDLDVQFTAINFRIEDDRGKAALQLAERSAFDLIFSMGSESTAWAWQNYRGGRLPVVSVCSKDPVQLGQMPGYETGSGTNFAFTSLNMPVEAQLAYVLELKPRLRSLGILVDAKNMSAVQTQAEPMARLAAREGLKVLTVAVQDPSRAAEELRKLLPQAVATMRKSDPDLSDSAFVVTGSTAVFREIATINAHADRVPVLSMVPEVVGPGDDSAVLSVGISFQSNGHLAAIYGADVLRGRARMGELKVGIVSPPDIAINFRKAREIGLKVPFRFFESASFVYDYDGRPVRVNGRSVVAAR